MARADGILAYRKCVTFSAVQEKYGGFLESEGLSLDIMSAGDDAEISTDPRKIWSVFDNIIYNVVRYTESGCVTVSAETTDSVVGLYIVKSVMEGCGGSVAARSKQGMGMSVILTFNTRPAV